MNTIKSKLRVTLLKGKPKSVAQLASQFRTTESCIRGRISELRDEGLLINTRVSYDTKGRKTTFYQVQEPTKHQITMAMMGLRILKKLNVKFPAI